MKNTQITVKDKNILNNHNINLLWTLEMAVEAVEKRLETETIDSIKLSYLKELRNLKTTIRQLENLR